MRLKITAFLITLAATCTLFSQESDSGPRRPGWVQSARQDTQNGSESGNRPDRPDAAPKWVPNLSEAPERTARDQAELHILFRSATAGDRTTRLSAVERIVGQLKDGRFSQTDPEIVRLLANVALAPTIVERRGAPVAGYPLVRMRAVDALSFMQGPQVRDTLLRVIRNEEESVVLAAAMRSLATIRTYPDEEVSESIVWMMRRHPRERIDGILGMSVLDAIMALDSVGAGIQSPELYRELIDLAQHTRSGRIRQRAYEVLNALREK